MVVAVDDRQRSPGDDDYDPTIDSPDDALLEDLRPKGPMAILSGLPWWFPLAIGWFLAPALPTSPLNDIFSTPTPQQERQILREERSMFSDQLENELYGKP